MSNKLCLQCNKSLYRYKLSDKQWEARRFCSHICFGRYMKRFGLIKGSTYWKGKHMSEETKEKDRQAHLGDKSSFWKGGISKVPGYYTHKALERQARLKGAEGTFSLEEWNQLLCKHEYKCVHCGCDGKLTKDHIIPLTKGGSNYISNIQPLCQSCNSRKRNKV